MTSARIVAAAVCVLVAISLVGCAKSDDELMTAGEQSAAHQQWSNAIESYRTVITRKPDGPRAAEAHYKIAMILYGQLKDVARGAAGFELVAGKFPNSAEAPKSLMILGFLFAEEAGMKHPDSSRAYYARLIERYPNSELARGAQLQLDQTSTPQASGEKLWRGTEGKSPSARELAH